MNVIALIRNRWFLVGFGVVYVTVLWGAFQRIYRTEIVLDRLYSSESTPNPDVALESYRDMTDAGPPRPRNARWFYRLAEVLTRAGKDDEAIEVWDRLVALRPHDRSLNARLALDLHNAERYGEAEQYFRELLQRQSALGFTTARLFAGATAGQETETLDETFLLLMGARNAAKAGEPETAISRYQRLVDRNSGPAEARHELGWVLLMVERLNEAAEQFETVLKENPNHVLALRALLDTYKKSARNEETFEILQRLVTLVPDDRDLRLQLALELHKRGRYAEAEKHIRILLPEGQGR